MSYIPVGTLLTYTATIKWSIFNKYSDWNTIAAQLTNDLPNLPGMEELDVQTANGSRNVFANTISLIMQVLNNGIDHGDENDIASIINGTIQSYGNELISGNITQIKLPNSPPIDTGANSNAPLPSSSTSTSSIFSGLSLSGGTIFGLSTTIVIIAIVALVLLLPGNARKLIGG
jgi:hypothetical protein